MSPEASSTEALSRMRLQARRDTKPEIALRRELHRRGLRYRVDRVLLSSSRRRHDIVFSSARVVVEVLGCFWHACPEHGTQPKSNALWWAQKLAKNQARDRDTETRLRASGWTLLVVWEHEDPVVAADRVEAAVRARQGRGHSAR